MSDLQNQIIALRRKVSELDNSQFVYFTEPKNPGPQTIWIDSTERTAKFWNGSNWILPESGGLTDWNATVVFTASDYRTIDWTSGVVSIWTNTSKTDYATSSGSFVMTTTTYFYWQEDNPTSIQTTTTPGDVVTSGGVLIAVGRLNSDLTSKASLKVFGGPSVDQIISDQIVANSITANMIQANAVTASKISVTSLSAINADLGTITAGTITLPAGGFIRSGQTAYNTGTGFYIGNDAGITKLSLWSSTGNNVLWDGTTLTVNGYNAISTGTFGGNGSDGIVPDANLTVTGSNGTIINKNYSSWTAGSTARVFTITPTNCILYIKIKGNADFTNWTFNFAGKGALWGAKGTTGAGVAGSNSSFFTNVGGGPGTGSTNTGNLNATMACASGGGGASVTTSWNAGSNGTNSGFSSATNGTGGAAGTTANSFSSTTFPLLRQYSLACGSGGGGGGSEPNFTTNGGDGGAGGGCVIFEVAGNLNLGSAAINCNGATGWNGTVTANGSGTVSGGGGGGGGGGCFVILYNGTLTGSASINVAGGAGGSGPQAGWAGWAGISLTIKNTLFA